MEMLKRKPNRLKNYDYSTPGAYFITICTRGRKNFFWYSTNVGANCVRLKSDENIQIRKMDELPLNENGIILKNEIEKIDTIYGKSIAVDTFVIMPNHVHLLISITDTNDGRTQFAPTLSRVIKQLKGSVTKQTVKGLWQKSFYDHIIRNETDYLSCYNYIITNPINWEKDTLYIE